MSWSPSILLRRWSHWPKKDSKLLFCKSLVLSLINLSLSAPLNLSLLVLWTSKLFLSSPSGRCAKQVKRSERKTSSWPSVIWKDTELPFPGWWASYIRMSWGFLFTYKKVENWEIYFSSEITCSMNMWFRRKNKFLNVQLFVWLRYKIRLKSCEAFYLDMWGQFQISLL